MAESGSSDDEAPAPAPAVLPVGHTVSTKPQKHPAPPAPSHAPPRRPRSLSHESFQGIMAAGSEHGGGGAAGVDALAAAVGVDDGPKTWVELGLSRPLLRAVAAMGFTEPTLIQARGAGTAGGSAVVVVSHAPPPVRSGVRFRSPWRARISSGPP